VEQEHHLRKTKAVNQSPCNIGLFLYDVKIKTTIGRHTVKKTIIALSLSLVIAPVFAITNQAGNNSTASTQATATVSATCTIQANNLSFGSLVLPIASQGASTSMNVLCSKNASYTINLAYGGVYGSGSSVATGTLGSAGNYFNNSWIGGTGISYSEGYCAYNVAGQTDSYYTIAPNMNQADNYGCAKTAQLTIGKSYSYGVMTGVANGDSIAYSIQTPGNASTVWNTGLGSYTATGTGISQSIPVTGTLLPSQSTSPYPSPDSYLDTVTATVSF
jgi:spore coat protein U-like protein